MNGFGIRQDIARKGLQNFTTLRRDSKSPLCSTSERHSIFSLNMDKYREHWQIEKNHVSKMVVLELFFHII
jgi:hypothetical protein